MDLLRRMCDSLYKIHTFYSMTKFIVCGNDDVKLLDHLNFADILIHNHYFQNPFFVVFCLPLYIQYKHGTLGYTHPIDIIQRLGDHTALFQPNKTPHLIEVSNKWGVS